MSQSVKDIMHLNVEGHELVISNPDKMLWPKAKITKAHYLQKLIVLAPYLLPYCRHRYLTTIRYPDGVGNKSFFQKNCPTPTPDFVQTKNWKGTSYVILDSLPTLLWLGNLACLEFHPSLHFIDSELPAEWVIDLDPPSANERRIMEAASIVGELLDSLQIQSVPKTSGATGIQIVIPIQRIYTFEQLRKLGEFLARYLVERYPQLFTVARLKKDRGEAIYIDYQQHGYGKTLSAPYTPRGHAAATVSTPLTWEELRAGVKIEDFTLWTIEDRLHKVGDLIAQVTPQRLDAILPYLQ